MAAIDEVCSTSDDDLREAPKENLLERKKRIMKRMDRVYTRVMIAGWFIIAGVGLLLQGCAHAPTAEVKVPRIAKEQVMPMLGNPDVIILDVRTVGDWNNADWKIKGAIREERNEKDDAWTDKYPKSKTIIIYCA